MKQVALCHKRQSTYRLKTMYVYHHDMSRILRRHRTYRDVTSYISSPNITLVVLVTFTTIDKHCFLWRVKNSGHTTQHIDVSIVYYNCMFFLLYLKKSSFSNIKFFKTQVKRTLVNKLVSKRSWKWNVQFFF